MDKTILQGILIAVSIFEIWLCYQVLFMTVIEKSCLRIIDKCIMWGNILIIGILLGINRKLLFFSSLMFLLCIIIVYFSAAVFLKKKKGMLIAIVILFFSCVALVDFFFAFLSMSFMGQSFDELVYLNNLSVWKCSIFLVSRFFAICIFIWLKTRNIKAVIWEFHNFLWMLDFFSILLVIQYQMMLEAMSGGDLNIRGELAGFSIIFIIVIFGFIWILLLKNNAIQNENEFLAMQDKLMVQKYQEIEQERENNRRVLHDIKNHFFVLKTYQKEKNYEGIHNYLEEIEAEFNQASGQIWTGNRIVDLILNQKKAQAEQLHIIFEIQAVPIPMWPMKESELCSFWGNLLDNAIEACCVIENGRRWISIAIEPQKSMLFIRINNSMKETPIIKKRKFISRKPQSEKHGYGLKNVERIVHRYDGEISYTAEQNTFEIRITFFEINVGDVKAT